MTAREALAGRSVLVTGGAGFIGSHLVDRLLVEGAREVVVIDNLFLGSVDNLREALASGKVTLYRDDYRTAFKQPSVKVTNIPFDINGIDMILVDDVLYTGRTVRAALDALTDFGRPKTIQCAVLIDRGHREMPIVADYAGMSVTTRSNQEVALKVMEIDNEDSVWLMEHEAGD